MNHNKEAGNTTPPFPEAMTFREMLTNTFNVGFMTEDELQTICIAGEMYANGCLAQERKAAPPSLSIEQEAEAYASRHHLAGSKEWIGLKEHYAYAVRSRQKQIQSLEEDLNDQVASYNVLKAASDIAVKELEAWKQEAISVMPDMQQIGKLLGVKLGQSVHDKIVPGIRELQGKLKIARDLLQQAADAYGAEWITEALKKIQ